MTEREFRGWSSGLLGRLPAGPARAFDAAVALASAGRGTAHSMESSLHSARGAELVKVGHFFRYPARRDSTPARWLDASAVLDFVSGLGAHGGRFDAERLSRLLPIPVRSGSRNDVVGFAADFDRRTLAFEKISFYLSPRDPADLVRLGLGRLTARDAEGLEFAGLDLRPDGSSGLKLYARRRLPGGPGRRALLKTPVGPARRRADRMWYVGGREDGWSGLRRWLGVRFAEACGSLAGGFRPVWVARKGRDREAYFG